MKNTKLTPTQIKLKKVLKPIVENILKEGAILEKSFGIDDCVLDIYSDNTIKLRRRQSEIPMDSTSAKKLARLILKNL